MAMTVAQARLWNDLESIQLDDPRCQPPFTERLGQEHGWSAAFAARVVHEYRRFLLLAATDESLTVPSDAVDQAWHLHLVDTHAYWDQLCSSVIGKALHHTPSRGGDAELEHHQRGYEATLLRYRSVFDQDAPEDIWPPTRDRFGARHRRVDLRNVWLIPKRLPWLSMAAWAVLATIALLALTGIELSKSDAKVARGLGAVAMGVLLTAATNNRRREGDGCGSVFDAGSCGTDGGCGGCGGCG